MKEGLGKMRQRRRIRLDEYEVARARRLSTILSEYAPTSLYALTAEGNVYQTMFFRKGEYTHGSNWNVVQRGTNLEDFQAKYEGLGFKISVWEKHKRVNYEKVSRVERVLRQPTREELKEWKKAITHRLDGKTYKQIEELMEKPAGWAHRIIKRASVEGV